MKISSQSHWRSDLPAGLVVFFVALPLCLGIALASEAPLFSGLIAGIVGGIVIGWLSPSHVSVSGPAAGLSVIVATAITQLGSFPVFLAAVVIAGGIQLALGLLRLGNVANYVPTSVIKGMLAAIGVVIVLKQIPHALGRDSDFEGDLSFLEPNGRENTVSAIVKAILSLSEGALLISVISVAVLIAWPLLARRVKRLASVPAPLVVVVIGIALNALLGFLIPSWALLASDGHLVSLPVFASPSDAFDQFIRPEWSAFTRRDVLMIGATIAVVASLESLLSLEAAEKLDPQKRFASPHRELVAQGVGNIASGLLGGLPTTAVVLRTSANVYAGARSRWSSVLHGALLLVAVAFVGRALNLVPLASLASILLVVGTKLAPKKLFVDMWNEGTAAFIPFIVTILAVVGTDLLKGVVFGIIVGLFFVIRANRRRALTIVNHDNYWLIRANKDLTFLNKAELKTLLDRVPHGANLTVDGSRALYIDGDIVDVINDYEQHAALCNITLEIKEIGRPQRAEPEGR